MRDLPHDLDDLRLAPLVLQLEDRLTELGALDAQELRWRVALDTDLPDWDEARRQTAMMVSVERDIDLHGWVLTWDPRGLRMTHGDHHVVLGLPASVAEYVSTGVGLPNR